VRPIIDSRRGVVGSNAFVLRFYYNDCWNIALALAVNKPYDTVRKQITKLNGVAKCGAGKMRVLSSYALNHGYENYNKGHKTVRALLNDTQFTEYEYLACSVNHVVYARYGVVYDSINADLIRLVSVFRRKINKRRKPLYNLVPKGGVQNDSK